MVILDKKSAMPDSLRPLALEAKRRHGKRPIAPDIWTLPANGGSVGLACPYRAEDEELWWALLLECFGTRVYQTGAAFLHQVQRLCPTLHYEGERYARADEEWLRQALSIVFSLKVRNEAEACLAAQIVAIHFSAMRVGENLADRYCDPRTAATLAALTKTFVQQLEAMKRLRGGRSTSRQTIKVQKSVTINYDQRRVYLPGEGVGESGSQAQAPSELRARARHGGADVVTPLRSPNESRQLVPIASGEGQGQVPDARGLKRVGGAEG